MNKVLIDTNVWVDVALERDGFFEASRACLIACAHEDIDMYVVATSLKDVFYWVQKAVGAKKAYQAVAYFMDIAETCPVDGPLCRAAIDLERPDYEDGIIAACAISSSVEAIISRDKKAFKHLDIKCYTPAEFLDKTGWSLIDI